MKMIEKTRRSRRSRELRRRGLALLLSLTMCVGMLSFDTFAMEGELNVTVEESAEVVEIQAEADEPETEEIQAEADEPETEEIQVEADGSETEDDETEADGSETEADEIEADGSESGDDETEADGSESGDDETKADGSEIEADETEVDGSEAGVDETETDGSETETDETEADRSESGDDETETDGSEAETDETEAAGSVDKESSEAPVKNEIPTVEETTVAQEIPAEVQGFLAAVAVIPADIDADNAEEAGERVNAALDAYEALIDAGLDEYEGVAEALETVYAAYAAVEEALALKSSTFDVVEKTDNVTTTAYSQFEPNTSRPNWVDRFAEDGHGEVVLTDDNPTATDVAFCHYSGAHIAGWPNGFQMIAVEQNTDPAVATAKARTSENGLIVEFQKGQKTGTTTICVGFTVTTLRTTMNIGSSDQTHAGFSGYLYYTVKNQGDGTVVEPEKPAVMPNANNIYVKMFCDSYTNPNYSVHFGNAGYLSNHTEKWSLGEIVPCDWMEGYEWFCPLNMDMDKWTSFYNSYYGSTHMFSMFGHSERPNDRDGALNNSIPANQLGFYWNGSKWVFWSGYLYIAMTEYSSQIDYTVVHEYYTDGKFDGSVSETKTNAKTGTKIYARNLTKKTTYGGNTYTYSSAAPDPLVCCDDVTANVITLRYERDPEDEESTTYLIQREYYIDGERVAKVTTNPDLTKGEVGDEIVGQTLVDQNPGWKNYTVDTIKYTFSYAGSYEGSYILKGPTSYTVTCGDKAPSITLVKDPLQNAIILRYEVWTEAAFRDKEVTIVKEFIGLDGNTITSDEVPTDFALDYSYVYDSETAKGSLTYSKATKGTSESGHPTLTWKLDVTVDEDTNSDNTTPLTITENNYAVEGYTWKEQDGLNSSNEKAVTGTYDIDATADPPANYIRNYYTKDKDPGRNADYTVGWYDASTGEKLTADVKTPNPETRNGKVGDTVSVTDDDKSVEGYTFKEGDDRNKLSAILSESGTVLKLYFTKDPGKTDEETIDYTVEWYDASTGEKLPAEVTPDKENPVTRKGETGKEVSVTDADKSIKGYTFKADDDRNVLSGTLNDKLDTVLKLYFTKDPETPEEKKADYTVEWYDADTGEKLPAEVTPDKENPETRNGEVDEEVSVTEADKTINGYTFKADDSRNKLSDTLAETGTALKLYFTKDPKPTSYKVVHEYWTNGVRNIGLTVTEESKPGNVGDKISVTGIEKKLTAGGNTYTYTSATAEELELTDNDTANVIILRYDRTVAGTVTEPDTPSGGGPSGGGGSSGRSTSSVPRSVTSIPDEAVPLADIPDALLPLSDGPVEDTIFTSILDEDVPLVGMPRTGDRSQDWMWMFSALLSGLGIVWLTLKKKSEDGEG